MIEDLLNLLKGMILNPKSHVAKDDVGGLTVSTVETVDMGFETAILDANGTHPVERYGSREQAVTGHAAWVEKTPRLKKIIRLGYGTLVDDEEVFLKRR